MLVSPTGYISNIVVEGTASATGPTQPAPKVADLDVTLSNFTAPSDFLLTAGAYSGLVVIKLGPVASGGE